MFPLESQLWYTINKVELIIKLLFIQLFSYITFDTNFNYTFDYTTFDTNFIQLLKCYRI